MCGRSCEVWLSWLIAKRTGLVSCWWARRLTWLGNTSVERSARYTVAALHCWTCLDRWETTDMTKPTLPAITSVNAWTGVCLEVLRDPRPKRNRVLVFTTVVGNWKAARWLVIALSWFLHVRLLSSDTFECCFYFIRKSGLKCFPDNIKCQISALFGFNRWHL